MTTLRREAIKTIKDILQEYLTEEGIDSVAARIVDRLSELRGFAFLRSDALQGAGIDWQVAAGVPIKQEQIDQNVLEASACNAFEQALAFNPLAWDLNNDWKALKRFVVEQYEKDSDVFRKYAEWREGQGRFSGALNNKNILDKPRRFIELFPAFAAKIVMSKPRGASISKDHNDAPITYS